MHDHQFFEISMSVAADSTMALLKFSLMVVLEFHIIYSSIWVHHRHCLVISMSVAADSIMALLKFSLMVVLEFHIIHHS